jgi:hypothetical protein
MKGFGWIVSKSHGLADLWLVDDISISTQLHPLSQFSQIHNNDECVLLLSVVFAC